MKRMRRTGIVILTVLILLVGILLWSTARMWQQAALNQELIDSVRKGDAARLQRALQRGADPNVQASNRTLSPLEIILQALRGPSATMQFTPVLLIAMQGHSHLAAILLQHGANPNSHGLRGTPALMEAVAQYDTRLVGELLAHGANPNAPNADGDTALMWAAGERLMWGGNQYDMSLVKTLLEHGADTNARNQKGQIPLMWAIGLPVVGNSQARTAVGARSEVMVETLVAHGADVNAVDQAGDSVLAWSSQLDAGLLPWLLSHGANANSRITNNQFSFIQRQETPINNWSIRFGGVNNSDTLLMMFARRGDRGMVKLLLAHGADVNTTNNQGQTASQLATDLQVRALLRQACAKN